MNVFNGQEEMAYFAYVNGMITSSEYDAVVRGDMTVSWNNIFNIQNKDTPVPWGTYAVIYKGRVENILKDRLLGL